MKNAKPKNDESKALASQSTYDYGSKSTDQIIEDANEGTDYIYNGADDEEVYVVPGKWTGEFTASGMVIFSCASNGSVCWIKVTAGIVSKETGDEVTDGNVSQVVKAKPAGPEIDFTTEIFSIDSGGYDYKYESIDPTN